MLSLLRVFLGQVRLSNTLHCLDLAALILLTVLPLFAVYYYAYVNYILCVSVLLIIWFIYL